MALRFLATCTFLICCLLAVSSCKKNDSEDTQPIGICGVIYHPPQQILITVQYDDGTRVALDSFVVADSAGAPVNDRIGGQNVSGSYSATNGILPGGCIDSNGINGRYCLVNEIWLNYYMSTPAMLQAKGYVNGIQVFNEPYTITTSNNSLVKSTGKDMIIIPR